jgi:fatty acid kinase fatty acid binding subunit
MPRPAVVLIDPQASRRKDLSRGLSSLGYEVVPALDERQGRLYVTALAAAVVVAPLGFMGSGGAAGAGAAATLATANGGRTLLLLGERTEDGEDLPEEISYLAAGGLASDELVRRIHVLLLGREVGVEADTQLESLVGDLALTPYLELLRALHRAELSGRLVHAAGELTLAGGRVVAAAAGSTRGLKAFCRLSHLDSGAIRVVPAAAGDALAPGGAGNAGGGSAGTGSAAGEPEIREDLKTLIIRALEDRVHDAPDMRSTLRLEIGPDFFERTFTPRQKEVLAAVPVAPTVGRLVDRLTATDGEILRALGELLAMGAVAVEEPEAAVRVVTDSTSDLPLELARAHGIHIVPLLVIFGDRIFHDGVDLAAREFYERLETGTASPRTNPPPRGDFLKLYRESAAKKDIFSLHLSEKLSQTVVNARAVAAEAGPALAAQRPAGDRPFAIEVVDSASISLGLGLQALFAARMALRGLELPEIRRRIEAMRSRFHLLFVVDTLDYLARGGRIGKARALAGKVLGVKPILGVTDGEIAAVDRVRGGRAAHPRLIELFAQRVDPQLPVVAAVGHSKAPIWADRLRSLLEQRFVAAELLVSEIGPVVGTHAGPGTVGAALFQPTAEELPLIAPVVEPA